jgi:protease I
MSHTAPWGRKIAALAADGLEKIELVMPLRALQFVRCQGRCGVAAQGPNSRVNLHMPASRVGVDKFVAEANPDTRDGLLVPGGFINPDLLRQSAAARDFVRAFNHNGKPIVTLCHGPWVLASAGLLTGRTLHHGRASATTWSTPAPLGLTARSCGTVISPPVEGHRT